MQISMMTPGRQLLINAVGGGPKGVINGFEISTDAGFIPDIGGVGATPSPIVYSGTYTQIYKTIVTNDEVILMVAIPYNIAIPIGNIMIKFTNNIPFLWMAFQKVYNKIAKEENEHYAGDIYQIPFVLRYPSIASRLDLTNIADYYANCPISDNRIVMNDVWDNNCDEQMLTNSTYTFNLGRPIYAQRVKTLWWGTPFAMDLADTRGWLIDGGVCGDNYTYTTQTT